MTGNDGMRRCFFLLLAACMLAGCSIRGGNAAGAGMEEAETAGNYGLGNQASGRGQTGSVGAASGNGQTGSSGAASGSGQAGSNEAAAGSGQGGLAGAGGTGSVNSAAGGSRTGEAIAQKTAAGQKYGVIDGEKSDQLTAGQKAAIYAYMDRYYEALTTLKMQKVSDLFTDSAKAYVAFHENTWDYLIRLRKMQKSDLRLREYGYRMWVLELEEQEDGTVAVDMAERCIQRFAQHPQINSEYPGIWHDFVLEKQNGKWLLKEHTQWDGVFWNMMKDYRDTDLEELEEPEKIFSDKKEQLLEQMEAGIKELEEQAAEADAGKNSRTAGPGVQSGQNVGAPESTAAAGDSRTGNGGAAGKSSGSQTGGSGGQSGPGSSGSKSTPGSSGSQSGPGGPGSKSTLGGPGSQSGPGSGPAHTYNREAAVAYARRYAGDRNDAWHDYGGQGGNCQNYVSQCLTAGGIPMDTEGEAKWKWYSDGVNNTSAEAGCTMSWINVDSFYEYARDNEGAGLEAETDADYRSGRVGDLIMMGTFQDWNHIVMITEVVKNAAGETIDYLICSNTTDVKDFPASAYPLPRRALIRIQGWN